MAGYTLSKNAMQKTKEAVTRVLGTRIDRTSEQLGRRVRGGSGDAQKMFPIEIASYDTETALYNVGVYDERFEEQTGTALAIPLQLDVESELPVGYRTLGYISNFEVIGGN